MSITVDIKRPAAENHENLLIKQLGVNDIMLYNDRLTVDSSRLVLHRIIYQDGGLYSVTMTPSLVVYTSVYLTVDSGRLFTIIPSFTAVLSILLNIYNFNSIYYDFFTNHV